jgi:hypothetical protein
MLNVAEPRPTVVLWVCIALFFARVVGQIEVLLVAPHWLPAMQAWYSGLLPYPLLLPIQIALLMVMCVLAIRARAPRRRIVGRNVAARRAPQILRALALLYFVVMAGRLVRVVYSYGGEYYLHGAIPIAFHWVLALYILVWTRLTAARVSVAENSR